jgi:Caspase domain
MARIAIIIGVSNYTRQQALPACQNDADLIRLVLTSSNEYDDILFLTGKDTNSDEVKYQLTQFVDKHKSREGLGELGEVFFFYSGHGQFKDDEFYFLFSDFDESRRNKTSLKNSELDGYLRTLSPNLAVMIVDACNAGVQYVKDTGGIEAIIQKGLKEQGLKKIYFMFSSLFDQSSFAGIAVSHYTQSFIEAIYTNGRPEIRYRDIVDQITDKFEHNKDQRPFFVMQADNTEIFGSFAEKEKNEIRTRLEAITAIPSTGVTIASTPAKQSTLGDIIKNQAKDYLNDEEIVEAIEQLLIATRRFTPSLEIADLFKVEIESAKSVNGLPGVGEIGKWLRDNNREYFGRVVTRSEEYEEYENSFMGTIAAMNLAYGSAEKPKKIKKYKEVISGYELIWDKPSFWRVGLMLNTQFPNVPTFKLNILYLFSKLDIRLFYSLDERWPGPGDVGTRTSHGEWKAMQLRLRELKTNPNAILPVFTDFTNFVTERLKQIAGVQNELLTEGTDTPPQPNP